MNPLRHTLAAALLSLAVALPAAAAERTETREVTGFNGIALSAAIRVDVVQGERESVVLEGDEEALASLETVVERGSLRIRMRKDTRTRWRVSWNEKVRAKITARSLEALAINGSGDIRVGALQGGALAITISGSGDVKVDSGKVADLAVTISGSGDVHTGRLEAQRVTVSVAGSGDATVWAREALSVRVAGSGDVSYYGDPKVQKQVAGSGDIKRLGAGPG